jgi:hypothetical protein
MRSAIEIRKEHKAVCAKLEELEEKGDTAGYAGPLPKDRQLYLRLHSIQMTLEWVHPHLIKVPKGVPRHQMLIGHKTYVFGPVAATLYP